MFIKFKSFAFNGAARKAFCTFLALIVAASLAWADEGGAERVSGWKAVIPAEVPFDGDYTLDFYGDGTYKLAFSGVVMGKSIEIVEKGAYAGDARTDGVLELLPDDVKFSENLEKMLKSFAKKAKRKAQAEASAKPHRATISGNTLTLKDEDSKEDVTFTRQLND